MCGTGSIMRELIVGCGRRKDKKIIAPSGNHYFQNPVTLDINPDHHPDIIHDLEQLPIPFKDNSFDEIHAYEVLEHTGNQGNFHFFFKQFSDLWRILKPNGYLCATVPNWKSIWAFGDPSHKRIINTGSLVFLNQNNYEKQVGKTAISDYRYIYKADFQTEYTQETEDHFIFALIAIK